MVIDHEIVIAVENPNTPEVRRLLAERASCFDRLYAKEDRHAKPVAIERKGLEFFVVRASVQLVGCGVLLWQDTYGELKRFYVSEAHRGRGWRR
jgi:putative acetyltransferase